ncbi:MAG: restriction endonuclease [Rothia mucilaginosa]|uniref:Restriction endonuclease n=1 Tax=Rothia mucilaginosa TaxID=43675 RepID=A0A930KZV7_9MICC|nr:restriction endonuclease [Rothia mucilaginosa]
MLNKNHRPPPDVYIALLLPTLRRLSKTVPRTAAYVSEQLRQQTKALGSKKNLPNLESADFAVAVRTTLKILVALRYAQLMPRLTPWEKRKYLLTPLGAELTCTPHLHGSVPPRVVKQVHALCAQSLTARTTKKLKKQANALLATAEAEHRLIFGASDGDAITGMEPFLPATDTGETTSAHKATGAEHLAHALNSAGTAETWPVGQSPMDIILRASDSPVIHAQAEFAEHFTQDLIQHIHAVTPEYFEQIVADIFTALGFSTEVTGGADDKGVDVIARYSDGLDFAPIYIQVKHYCGTMKVTPNEIQKLAGAVLLHGGLQGVLVTCGAFAQPVPEYLQGLPGARNIALVDQHQLVELMIRHRVGVLDGEGECGYRIDEEYFARGME